jgi:hypothetical protein
MDLSTDLPANDRIHYCYRPFYGALCWLNLIRCVSNTRYCLTVANKKSHNSLKIKFH